MGEGQDGFDGEAEVADQVGVGRLRGRANEDMEGEEEEDEKKEEVPVAGGRVGR